MTEKPVTALDEVRLELARQDLKWGEQNHPDGTGDKLVWPDVPLTLPMDSTNVRAGQLAEWAKARCQAAATDGSISFEQILTEEIFEAYEETDTAKLREELIQVAAVATQWVAAIDRRTPGATA